MSEERVRLAVRLTRRLPAADVDRLARPAELGRDAVAALRSSSAGTALRAAREGVLAVGASAALAGALRGLRLLGPPETTSCLPLTVRQLGSPSSLSSRGPSAG